MKIRCIANQGAYLPETYLNPPLDITKETEFKLIVGKEYILSMLSLNGKGIYRTVFAMSGILIIPYTIQPRYLR